MVTLTTKYQKLRDELKSQIRTANVAWWRIGEILCEIKDGKLYLEEGLDWEGFCEKCFGFSKRHSDSLIKDAKTHAIIDTFYRGAGGILPKISATATHELSDVPKREAIAIVKRVSKTGPVTAAKIKQAKARVVSTEENLPMHTDASDAALAAATPREGMRPLEDVLNEIDGERRCPHCGGAL